MNKKGETMTIPDIGGGGSDDGRRQNNRSTASNAVGGRSVVQALGGTVRKLTYYDVIEALSDESATGNGLDTSEAAALESLARKMSR